MKEVIIFEEKQGLRIFDASTSELVAKAMVKIVKERLEQGWYNANAQKVAQVVIEAATVNLEHAHRLARNFLGGRRHAEYENYRFEFVEEA